MAGRPGSEAGPFAIVQAIGSHMSFAISLTGVVFTGVALARNKDPS